MDCRRWCKRTSECRSAIPKSSTPWLLELPLQAELEVVHRQPQLSASHPGPSDSTNRRMAENIGFSQYKDPMETTIGRPTHARLPVLAEATCPPLPLTRKTPTRSTVAPPSSGAPRTAV